MQHTRQHVERYGQRLIRYRLNADGTRHAILYTLGGLFFEWIADSGRQVDVNGRPVDPDTVKGRTRPGKYWREYRDSARNEQSK